MRRTPSPARCRRSVPLAALAGAALLFAACSGGSGGSASRPSGSTASGPAATPVDPAAEPPAAPAPQDPAVSTTPAAPAPAPAPAPPRYVHEWVVSPSGSDSAAGTATAPFRTIMRGVAAAGPGDRVTVRAGTYAERVLIDASVRSGTAAQPVLLQGEGLPKIVPGDTAMTMVAINRPGWVVDGFEVDARGQNRIGVGFYGAGTEGSALRNSVVHGGSGPEGVETKGAAGVTIENNEVHHFWRSGEDSHGVAVAPGSVRITVRNNKIHDVSGDSIQCIGPEGESSLPPAENVLVEGNDLYSNYENALDVKTCKHVVARKNSMHDFLINSPGGCAVVIHMSADDVLVEDNEIFRVGKAVALGGNHIGPVPHNVRIQHNRIHDVQSGYQLEGVGVLIQNSSGARVVGNSFARIARTAISVGDGDGGPTDSLRIADNLLDADEPLVVGAYAPGLSVGPNGFRPAATFWYHGTAYGYSGWKALGFGAPSWLSSAMYAAPDTLAPAPGAIDQGSDEGLPFCGAAPDLGAVETGC
ncbi:MAG TPA: right-handed parallel beta-helix repeat-containing protein [Myxococcales bacterium]|nr:right-handed parallel beta-helix repeat-containing protein [Myxococcales bacterium]